MKGKIQMGFSYNKMMTLRPQKEKKLFTFLVAIAVAASFFVPYMIMGEGYFTFYGDFNVQQINFYKMCHEAVRQGNIGWNWSTDLGANFIGSYAFYLLGSPFFWLTIPFPNNFVPYLMGPLLILKFGCAALTGYLYIRRFTKTAYAASLGGLLYAFSGFSIYNIFFNHFHEAIIVFPLLLLSIEALLVDNRRGVFALAVALCAVTNYFFFFGMVVFAIIYFIVRLTSGAIKIKFSRFLVFGFEAVLGLLLSAILLLPALYSIMGNDRISEIQLGWSAIMYGKEQIYFNIIECFFFPPDLPARPVFFPKADVKWSSLGGWLPVFSMTGVFVCFMQKSKSWQKRVLGICIFMALVPFLNSAFYAFNYAYYARWFYMPILIMCLITVMLTEDKSIDWWSGFRWTAGITLAITLVIGLFPQETSEGDYIIGLFTTDNEGDYMYLARFWATCAIAIAGLVILFFLIRQLKKNREAFYKTSIVCVCIITSLYANFFVASGRAHSHPIKPVVIDQNIEGSVDLGEGNFRIDVYDGVDNTGMALGLPSINAFHSVVPTSITEYYEYIGIERVVASRPEVEYSAIRPFLSVKYLLNSTYRDDFVEEVSGDTRMPDYKYIKTENNYKIYENKNYIPYGFSYDYYISYEDMEGYSTYSKTKMMLKAIVLTDEQIEKYGYMYENVEDIKTRGKDGTTLRLDDGEMAKDAARRAKTSADSFKIDNGGFTATVKRDKETLVFFSVPYEDGWSATVNGKAVDVEKVNVGFMAVKVPKGESTIRFNYKTPYLSLGIVITVASAVVLGVYLLIFAAWNKKHPTALTYPEGDALMDMWKEEELYDAVEKSQTQEPFWDEDFRIIDIPPRPNGLDGGFLVDNSIFDDDDT